MSIITLIGMPGCGKTFFGKRLAQKIQWPFVDLDEYIESHHRSIPSLFEKGEHVFRDIETQALKACLDQKEGILSTGGGIVCKQENRNLLKAKSKVFFIDRPMENIKKDVDLKKRPLLKDHPEKLDQLYEQRYHLYIETAHYHIINDGSYEEVLDKIFKIIKKWP